MITFVNNMLTTRSKFIFYVAPREIRIILPSLIEDQPINYKPLNSREGLVLESDNPKNRNHAYYEFLNKLPIWDEKN